jgi:hypothetical protein
MARNEHNDKNDGVKKYKLDLNSNYNSDNNSNNAEKEKDNRKNEKTDLEAGANAARIVAKAKAMQGDEAEKYAKEHSEEKKRTFKDLSFKEKWEHICYYYKWYFVGTVIGVACMCSIIYAMFIYVPPTLWCGIAVYGENISFDQTDTMRDELNGIMGLDGETNTIEITDYYEDSTDVMVLADLNQKFNTYIYGGEFNLLVSTKEAAETFVTAEYVEPLTSYLSSEEIEELDKNGMIYYTENPETQATEPMSVIVKNSKLLNKYGLFTEEEAYISFVPMAENIDNSIKVLHEFMK